MRAFNAGQPGKSSNGRPAQNAPSGEREECEERPRLALGPLARGRASRARKEAMRSNRARSLLGTMRLSPGTDFPPGVVQTAGGVFVAAGVHRAQVPG